MGKNVEDFGPLSKRSPQTLSEEFKWAILVGNLKEQQMERNFILERQ